MNSSQGTPRSDILTAAVFMLIIPGAMIYLSTGSVFGILPVLSSTLVLEYAAVPLVRSFGHSTVLSILYVTSIGFGSIFLIFAVLDLFYLRLECVRKAAEWFRKRALRSRWLEKYGIYGLLPGVSVIGAYACTVFISFAGWPRRTAVLLTMTGFIICEFLILVGFNSLRDLWMRIYS